MKTRLTIGLFVMHLTKLGATETPRGGAAETLGLRCHLLDADGDGMLLHPLLNAAFNCPREVSKLVLDSRAVALAEEGCVSHLVSDSGEQLVRIPIYDARLDRAVLADQAELWAACFGLSMPGG